jgi:hypothetical protein
MLKHALEAVALAAVYVIVLGGPLWFAARAQPVNTTQARE